jgi:hypothetical protein
VLALALALKLALVVALQLVLVLVQVEMLVYDDKLDLAEKLLNELFAIEPHNEEIYIQKANIYSKKPENISAKTGASVTGGDRSITTIEIDDAKINKGFKLRFETAVEDHKYYTTDLEIPLTTEGIAAKTEGKNYIRYVRLNKI